jgi:hypothetical protein
MREIARDPAYRTYSRAPSPTQTPHNAWQQIHSGELWGRVPRDSSWPQVQAFRYALYEKDGLEFVTRVPPDQSFGPHATWSWGPDASPRPGVRLEDGFAKIDIIVTRSTQ